MFSSYLNASTLTLSISVYDIFSHLQTIINLILADHTDMVWKRAEVHNCRNCNSK